MLKNLFKSAKQALKNPIVQLGIGALIPGSSFVTGMGSSLAKTILSNPALLQGGIGLLAGDKPENVARNIGIQALLGGFKNMGAEGGFSEGVKNTFSGAKPEYMYDESTGTLKKVVGGSEQIVSEAERAARGAPEGFLGNLGSQLTPDNLIDAATLIMPFAAAALDDANQQQLDPTAIAGLDLQNYQDKLAQSQYQATGGITGFAAGGYDPTNGMKQVSYGSTMGEPNGLFTGPGGPKEDKIDVKLSPGEFVFTAESAEKIGPDNLYAIMNSVDSDSERPEQYRERVGMA